MKSNQNKCEGHPAGEFDPMGQTVFCDGSCVPFTSKELRDRIQKQAFSRWPDDERRQLRKEEAEQDARDEAREKYEEAEECQ